MQHDNVADQDDAYSRLRSLGLDTVGSIGDLPLLRRLSETTASPGPRNLTAVGYLQQILGCMAEALAFVHKQGIRHGDLNPKNILLSPDRVYLADFGVARDVKESENSITSQRYGTPLWMAPEVHGGMNHRRSLADIWSLGSIFLKILSVLYEEGLEKYDEIMTEQDWKKKYEVLSEYLKRLKSRGEAAGFQHPEAQTFSSKHTINLVEKMLDFSPEHRPCADKVNFMLTELGGLDQIYHLQCCHKPNSAITEIIGTEAPSLTKCTNRV